MASNTEFETDNLILQNKERKLSFDKKVEEAMKVYDKLQLLGFKVAKKYFNTEVAGKYSPDEMNRMKEDNLRRCTEFVKSLQIPLITRVLYPDSVDAAIRNYGIVNVLGYPHYYSSIHSYIEEYESEKGRGFVDYFDRAKEVCEIFGNSDKGSKLRRAVADKLVDGLTKDEDYIALAAEYDTLVYALKVNYPQEFEENEFKGFVNYPIARRLVSSQIFMDLDPNFLDEEQIGILSSIGTFVNSPRYRLDS